MLYRYLPKSAGLRRITLHKSISSGDKMYLLLCECSNFLENLSAAAILLPALRARLCGYTGLYRTTASFWMKLMAAVRRLDSIHVQGKHTRYQLPWHTEKSSSIHTTFINFKVYKLFLFFFLWPFSTTALNDLSNIMKGNTPIMKIKMFIDIFSRTLNPQLIYSSAFCKN